MADDVKKINIDRNKQRFEEFLNITEEERQRAEKRRDYRDLKQWTAKQVATLEARKQAPIIFDQYSQKVDSICGLEVQGRSDPKALPVHPKHEQGAEVITDALRFVESRQHLDQTFSDAFEDKLVEGYGGVITEVEKVGKEWVIQPRRIPWDRIYFDPYSRNKDFSDSGFYGITLWMDIEDAIRLNPKRKNVIKDLVDSSRYDDDTFEDRPNNWRDSTRKRIRVNQEYYLDAGKWMVVYYSGDTIIIDPKESDYKDDDDLPMCPIELDSDFIDRENNRWGYMQRLMDVQDEINHRRSKALNMLSRKKVIADAGAFPELSRKQVLSELAKAESYLEKSPGTEINIDDNQELGRGQLEFYQDAKFAMDSVGTNPELAGRTNNAVSGRAYIARQQSGMVELARIFANHSALKKRVYRQIWLRMRQYWTQEKWIRVSDTPNATKFVGLNVPVTFLEQKLEKMTGKNIRTLRQNNPRLDEEIQAQYQADPRLAQVVETRNNVKELDMDITIEEGPDSATLQQEQFDTIANLAATRGDPQMFRALVMMSSIKNKKEVLELLEGDEEQAAAQAQAQEEARQIELQQIALAMGKEQAEIANIQADTMEKASKVGLNEAKTAAEGSEVQQEQSLDEAEQQAKIRKLNAEAEAQEIENALVESGVIDELEAMEVAIGG